MNKTYEVFMREALKQAELGIYTTSPNPNVGCVVVKDGKVVGKGYHYQSGMPHAEVYALEMAGDNAIGADLYVTLEPCCHYGKTPPCINKIISSGIKKVVIGMLDPYLLVSGKGILALRNAGIDVVVGILENDSRELNLGFISRVTRSRPWVSVKLGVSLDGRTSLQNGTSRWITCQASREDVHKLRARSDLIITGSNTVCIDNPLLNVRGMSVNKSITKLIIDSKLRTEPDSLIYNQGDRVLLATNSKKTALKKFIDSLNIEIWDDISLNERVNLPLLFNKISKKEYSYVLVEAGMNLNGALLEHNLIDELILYMSPKILGTSSLGMFQIPEIENLENKFGFNFHSVNKLDKDIKIILRKNI
ncbi:MAG: bifunctional diaminohydroxyphosphoribosylaminopyrimidine deaminase/5-amino-6-(5-phosphoribosylamino)uracil reductase RibD [Neisseriaceae bacterium]|nr:MAG: bifunctional diaminohydroxyphosphoribosylaminopyrimidine deaminase/5-amino-6-(5-phosphoribosylamino)uracil reductase RibD [Neisseriaceae bacterium]